MRAALYARYSSDNQRDASIADQLSACRRLAEREHWPIEAEYTDHAISGASLARAGFQKMMRDAIAGRFDLVLAESLDRFSRDQEDTAGLFKRLTFAGVRIVTLAEGEVGHLHVGLKGTMNALFLKDLADKTRRGLRGRIEAGRSGGGLCFGYSVVRSLDDAGKREINSAEAAVVTRIFKEYASGMSPKAIAKRLNSERVPGPNAGLWASSTINGNATRGTGILNNELYIGRLVWNRLRYVKNPDSGRRVSRLNSTEDRVLTEVPELRIVEDDLWAAAKQRQCETRKTVKNSGLVAARRPRYLFSGLTKCGVCGAGFSVGYRGRLACFGARERGSCGNHLTIGRDEVEARVLSALRDKLLNQELFEEFCQEFTREMNRLLMEEHGRQAGARRELVQLEGQRKKLVQSIMDGVPGSLVKDDLIAVAARREELECQLAQVGQPKPLLHPNMAALYRSKVNQLAEALEHPDTRTEAAEALRVLVQAIILTPQGDKLGVELRGDLAAMLGAAQNAKRSPETGDLSLQVKVVAGAGFEPATFGL